MKDKSFHLENSIKKGTIEIMLLKFLSESDMYGYQLSQKLKKRSNLKYTILEGSMYPILYRLTEQGYITFYETKVGIRQTRVYYHIEESGRQYLKEQITVLENTFDLIRFLLNSVEGDSYDKFKEKN